MLSSQRIIELANKGLEVSQSLQNDADLASSGHNLSAIKYIQQETIVLKKVMQALASIVARRMINGLTEDEDE